MDKMLVSVYVPIISRSYDMFVPIQSPMYDVLELVKRAVLELSDGMFIPKDDNVICYKKNGKVIDINCSVAELDIYNGSQLMLI